MPVISASFRYTPLVCLNLQQQMIQVKSFSIRRDAYFQCKTDPSRGDKESLWKCGFLRILKKTLDFVL